jgi:hypothetical protein
MILVKKCSDINAWNYVTGLSLNMQTATPAMNSSQCLLHSQLVASVTCLQQIRSEDCFCKEVSLHHFEGRRMFRESDLCCVLTRRRCSLSYSDKACYSLEDITFANTLKAGVEEKYHPRTGHKGAEGE